MSVPNPRMPFGKHKGKLASECPVEYLDWLIDQDWLRDPLREQILSHLTNARPEWHTLGEDEDPVDWDGPNHFDPD